MVLSMQAFVKCEELEEFPTSIESFLDSLQKHYQICDINVMECDVRKLDQYIEIFAALSSVLLTIRETPGYVIKILISFANGLRQCKFDVSKKLSDLSKILDVTASKTSENPFCRKECSTIYN